MPGVGDLPTLPSMPSLGDVIASNVRAERARRRWQQAELADRLGWGRSTVSDLEAGRRRVQADDLAPLCIAFNISLAKLIDGASIDDLQALRIAEVARDQA
jgi:transcriptional regulator with XRE-family HTH domain